MKVTVPLTKTETMLLKKMRELSKINQLLQFTKMLDILREQNAIDTDSTEIADCELTKFEALRMKKYKSLNAPARKAMRSFVKILFTLDYYYKEYKKADEELTEIKKQLSDKPPESRGAAPSPYVYQFPAPLAARQG
jgi:hypothetical protein